jgi:hypothetical protein
VQFHEWTMAKTVGIALLDLILLNSYAHHFSFILKISYHLRALSKFKETFSENQVIPSFLISVLLYSVYGELLYIIRIIMIDSS